MVSRLKLYCAPGKSITTARGIVSADHDQPEITPACLVKGEATAEQLVAAEKSIAHLLDLGVLEERAAPPDTSEANPKAATADVNLRGQHAAAPAGDPSSSQPGTARAPKGSGSKSSSKGSKSSGPKSGAQPAGS